MAQTHPQNRTAADLSTAMLHIFDSVVDKKISLEEAKVIQNQSAKIMTINMAQLQHDKFVGNKSTNPFFAR